MAEVEGRRSPVAQARHEAAHAERERIAEHLDVAAHRHIALRGNNPVTRAVANELREQAKRVRALGTAANLAPKALPNGGTT